MPLDPTQHNTPLTSSQLVISVSAHRQPFSRAATVDKCAHSAYLDASSGSLLHRQLFFFVPFLIASIPSTVRHSKDTFKLSVLVPNDPTEAINQPPPLFVPSLTVEQSKPLQFEIVICQQHQQQQLSRSFGNGCINVNDPFHLAAYWQNLNKAETTYS